MLKAVWPDCEIYWTLGNLSTSLATINLPKSPTFLGNFSKGVKIKKILVKSFLGNFYRHLETFYWSHWLKEMIWRPLSFIFPYSRGLSASSIIFLGIFLNCRWCHEQIFEKNYSDLSSSLELQHIIILVYYRKESKQNK